MIKKNVVVDKLWRGPNGKLDHTALKAMVAAHS